MGVEGCRSPVSGLVERKVWTQCCHGDIPRKPTLNFLRYLVREFEIRHQYSEIWDSARLRQARYSCYLVLASLCGSEPSVMSNMSDETLRREFLDHLQDVHDTKLRSDSKLKWYITAIIALAGMNYAELIPDLYTTLLSDFIPVPNQFAETRKIREGLTKCCGIWGAAKVCKLTPAHMATDAENRPALQRGSYSMPPQRSYWIQPVIGQSAWLLNFA